MTNDKIKCAINFYKVIVNIDNLERDITFMMLEKYASNNKNTSNKLLELVNYEYECLLNNLENLEKSCNLDISNIREELSKVQLKNLEDLEKIIGKILNLKNILLIRSLKL